MRLNSIVICNEYFRSVKLSYILNYNVWNITVRNRMTMLKVRVFHASLHKSMSYRYFKVMFDHVLTWNEIVHFCKLHIHKKVIEIERGGGWPICVGITPKVDITRQLDKRPGHDPSPSNIWCFINRFSFSFSLDKYHNHRPPVYQMCVIITIN